MRCSHLTFNSSILFCSLNLLLWLFGTLLLSTIWLIMAASRCTWDLALGIPGRRENVFKLARPHFYSVDLPRLFFTTDKKRCPCSFLSNTLPSYPPLSFLLSFAPKFLMPCWCRACSCSHRGSNMSKWQQNCAVKVFLFSSETLKSIMNQGDPLGDRFWLSPKKGKSHVIKNVWIYSWTDTKWWSAAHELPLLTFWESKGLNQAFLVVRLWEVSIC